LHNRSWRFSVALNDISRTRNCKSRSDISKRKLTSGQRISTKSRIACRIVTEDWMIPFGVCSYWRWNDLFCCLHRNRDSQCFSLAGQSPKNCPFPWGISTPSNSGFLGPRESAHTFATSISSAVFCNRQTNRQTDHATSSVAIGRIWLLVRCGLKTNKDVAWMTKMNRAQWAASYCHFSVF